MSIVCRPGPNPKETYIESARLRTRPRHARCADHTHAAGHIFGQGGWPSAAARTFPATAVRVGARIMAFMDFPLNAPHKHDKGQEGGSCNRQSCQAPNADWYNHGSYAWYCYDCAIAIGQDSFNKRDWELNWQPRLGHPMFETREMMDERDGGENGR